MPLAAGLTAETDVIVEDHLTADRMGNPGFKVLSTPALVQLFEAASIQANRPASGRTADRQRRHTDRGGAYRGDAYRHARAVHCESRQRRWPPRLLRLGSAR